MESTNIQLIKTENPDSLEIGTPGKAGAIKVYGNSSDKEGFQKKIDNMIELRNNAKSKTE